MSDIVERLREVQCETEFDAATCDMAAAEIERLRAVLHDRDMTFLRHMQTIAKLAIENKRLRAALEPFAKNAASFDGMDGSTPVSIVVEPHIVWLEGDVTVSDIHRARAALNKGEQQE